MSLHPWLFRPHGSGETLFHLIYLSICLSIYLSIYIHIHHWQPILLEDFSQEPRESIHETHYYHEMVSKSKVRP